MNLLFCLTAFFAYCNLTCFGGKVDIQKLFNDGHDKQSSYLSHSQLDGVNTASNLTQSLLTELQSLLLFARTSWWQTDELCIKLSHISNVYEAEFFGSLAVYTLVRAIDKIVHHFNFRPIVYALKEDFQDYLEASFSHAFFKEDFPPIKVVCVDYNNSIRGLGVDIEMSSSSSSGLRQNLPYLIMYSFRWLNQHLNTISSTNIDLFTIPRFVHLFSFARDNRSFDFNISNLYQSMLTIIYQRDAGDLYDFQLKLLTTLLFSESNYLSKCISIDKFTNILRSLNSEKLINQAGMYMYSAYAVLDIIPELIHYEKLNDQIAIYKRNHVEPGLVLSDVYDDVKNYILSLATNHLTCTRSKILNASIYTYSVKPMKNV